MSHDSPTFTHLHVHGEKSFLDGLSRSGALARRAQELGMNAIALTDHGNLTGALSFARACQNEGIKPIIGEEFYLAIGSRFERNSITVKDGDLSSGEGEKTKRYEHITLIAYNKQGWENLVRLHNASHEEYWYVPRIDYEMMEQYSEGIICLSGCLGGPVLGPLSTYARWLSLPERARAVGQRLQGRGYDLDALVGSIVAGQYENAGDKDIDQLRALIREKEQGYGADGYERAKANLSRLVSIYGPDRVFVEIMEHGIEVESAALPHAVKLAGEFNLPLVATNDSHYTCEHDEPYHDAWLAVKVSKTGYDALNDPNRFRFNGHGYWLRSPQEMYSLRDEPWWKQACANTAIVANMVEDNVMPDSGIHLPKFPLPAGYNDSRSLFIDLVKKGAQARYGDVLTEEVKQRLNYEMGIIDKLGLIDYFLIDRDVLEWAKSDYTIHDWITVHDTGVEPLERTKKKPIVIGPGRGSAGGSAVMYCLGIIDVDPIRHQLYFERFLDPTRIGMPDVDTDFEKGRRDEAYHYLVARYGSGYIARLGAPQTKKTKAALKDSFKLFGFSETQLNKLTKLVPDHMGVGEIVDPSVSATADVRAYLATFEDQEAVSKALEYAKSFEDLTSGESIHACGVLVSDREIDSFIPVRYNQKSKDPCNDVRITSWDGHEVDSLGLLKLDLLGIRTLDMLREACDNASRLSGQPFTVDDIPDPNDVNNPAVSATWAMLQRGKTASVFQLESSGMSDLIMSIAPRSWEHLTAAVALYRPGPMKANMHTKYADRLNERESVDYGIFSHQRRKDEIDVIYSILGETFGIPVYQEQAMALARDVAGFDDVGVNKIRKAISKKLADQFPVLEQMFIDGAVKNVSSDGRPKVAFDAQTARALWAAIEGSAQYSFNKSHSVAYAKVAFETAFMKANYPAAFGAAVLAHTDRTDEDKRRKILDSLEEEGIVVHPPDVNRSLVRTTAISSTDVVFGLGEIKDVASHAEDIVSLRGEGYKDLNDLFVRTSPSVTVLQGLIEAGACDAFGPRMGMVSIIGALKVQPDIAIPNSEWGTITRWIGQKTRIGLAFGDHPLNVAHDARMWEVDVKDERGNPISDPLAVIDQSTMVDGAVINAVGVISAVTLKNVRSGQAAFVRIENTKSAWDGAIWPKVLQNIGASNLYVGAVVHIGARVTMRQVEIVNDDDGYESTSFENKVELNISRLRVLNVSDSPTHITRKPLDFADVSRAIDQNMAAKPDSSRKVSRKSSSAKTQKEKSSSAHKHETQDRDTDPDSDRTTVGVVARHMIL